MNKLRMGVALIFTGLFLMACGRGFEPMKNKASSTGEVIEESDRRGEALPPGNTSVDNPFDISRQTTEQLTPELWPDIKGNNPTQNSSDNSQLFRVISGLSMVFDAVQDSSLVPSYTRDIKTQIANGCRDGKLLGETLSARVNLEYVKTSPNLIINIGENDNFKLRLACVDSGCKNATLYITAYKVPVQVHNGFGITTELKTQSAAVYMSRVEKGLYLPSENNFALANGDQHRRYVNFTPLPDYRTSCESSAPQVNTPATPEDKAPDDNQNNTGNNGNDNDVPFNLPI